MNTVNWHHNFYNIEMLLEDTNYDQAYREFKKMIALCFSDVDMLDVNYDYVCVGQIERQIFNFPIKYRISLCRQLIRRLNEANYEYDKLRLNKKIRYEYLKYSTYKRDVLSLKYIMNLLGYNVYTSLLAVVLMLMAISCSFIFTQFTPLQLFSSSTIRIVDSEYVNAFLNAIVYVFFDIDGVSIEPTTCVGLILMIAVKALFVLIFVNFIWTRIGDNLKEYDVY